MAGGLLHLRSRSGIAPTAKTRTCRAGVVAIYLRQEQWHCGTNGASLEANRYHFRGSTNLILYAYTSRNHRVCKRRPVHIVLDALFHLQDVDVCGGKE